MAKTKQKDSFWTSYSELMTSLFFVMLVLFIICLVKVGKTNGELKAKVEVLDSLNHTLNADNEDLRNIFQLEKQFKVLSESSSLEYDSIKKMFYAKDFQEKEVFYSNDDKIKQEYLDVVDTVGYDLLQILCSLNLNKDFKYQMVIEGNAAIKWQNLKSGNFNPDNVEMYSLSYRRALALYLYWKSKGFDFRKYNTEVIIAGSGFNGMNRDNKVEDYNKRFIIQIIPKINRPKVKK
ncbi:MAG: hypothetical protein K2I99_03515 [Bacteroidaceae bacterium]|nr:hypothetical protein [Bacteroidaceae bacterium]